MNAWDLVGDSSKIIGYKIRIVGGRTLYESARNTSTDNICLMRFDTSVYPKIRVISRYVKWNTPVELIPEQK